MPSSRFGLRETARPSHLRRLLGRRLVLDLDSDLGFVDPGTLSWCDQSGRSNTPVQATGATKPTQVASVLDGHAAIRFTSGQFLAKTSGVKSFAVGDKPRCYLIANFASTGAFTQAPFSLGASASLDSGMYIAHVTLSIAGVSKLQVAVTSVGIGLTDDGPARLYDTQITAANLTVISQGNAVVGTSGGGAVGGLANLIDRFYVGVLEDGATFPFVGDIFKLVVCNPAPAAQQHAALMSYFRVRYPSVTIA